MAQGSPCKLERTKEISPLNPPTPPPHMFSEGMTSSFCTKGAGAGVNMGVRGANVCACVHTGCSTQYRGCECQICPLSLSLSCYLDPLGGITTTVCRFLFLTSCKHPPISYSESANAFTHTRAYTQQAQSVFFLLSLFFLLEALYVNDKRGFDPPSLGKEHKLLSACLPSAGS